MAKILNTIFYRVKIFPLLFRCGMVYVDPGELRWKPYVQTWLDHKFPAKLTDATKVHIHTHRDVCIVLLVHSLEIHS